MKLNTRDNLVVIAALSGFSILLALGIMHHEAWGDEWQAINIARSFTSLPDLIGRLRYEGHPVLWYLFIRAVWEICPSLLSVQILNSLIALAAAGLIAFRAPWPLWLRLMVAFTGPAIWEYSVKVRSYGLGWLFIVVLALVLRLPARRSKAWLVALLATLALNTSLFTGFVAYALVAGWLWDEIRANWRQCIIPMGFMSVAAVVTLVLALPPPDSQIGLALNPVTSSSAEVVARIFTDVMLPFTNLGRTSLPVVLIVVSAIMYVYFRFICANTGARIALGCGWLLIYVYALLLKGIGSPWHQWHAFLLPLVAAIAFERRTTIPRTAYAALTGIAVLGLNCGIREYIHDWNGVYSGALPASRAIKTAGLADLPIVVYPYSSVPALSGYLERPLFDESCSPRHSYVIWNAVVDADFDTLTCARSLAETTSARMSLIVLPAPIYENDFARISAAYNVRLTPFGSYVVDLWANKRFMPKESFYVYTLTLM